MDLYYYLIFFGTVLGVSLIPGPSTFIAFAHGATFGWVHSVYTALGNSTASILQAGAASAGLGLVITSSALLFSAIKYVGAAYLIYVGIQMWRSAAQRVALASQEDTQSGDPRKLFISGFTVALSNPKAIGFFTALFPQFLSVDGNTWSQLGVMVALVAVGAFLVALLYGCLGAWVRGMELSRRFMSAVYKTTGGMFVMSGIGLATARTN